MARPTFVPVYEETETIIKDRIVARIPTTWRKEPGDFMYDAVAATPLEVKDLQANQDEILKNGFAQYAEGDYLDYKLSEVGLSRAQATPNKRNLTITADAGVIIPSGHTASVVILDNDGNPVEFTVNTAVTFDVVGNKTVTITCTTAGIIGNVPNGSQFILLPPIPGVSLIVDAGTTTAGTDKETDEAAWTRYDFKVKNPDTGGNKNDYVRWGQEVTGVGKAKCIPRWNGNGTVKVLVIDTTYVPASQAIVDSVQAYLDPLLNTSVEAEAFTLSGFGASGDTTQTDDSVNSLKLVYNAAGAGVATYGQPVEAVLQTENHFKARFKVKVDSIAGTNDLLQLTVQDRGTKVPLKQTNGGAQDAKVILKANQLTTALGFVEVPFYWDGLQPLEVEIRRLITDTATTVWVDLVNIVSMYGQALGDGKAPAGARVYVKAADNLSISIVATITLAAGALLAVVKTAFEITVKDYLKTLVFLDNTSVVYNKIGSLLIGTAGVANYSGLIVNGGAADVLITGDQVPTLAGVTFS